MTEAWPFLVVGFLLTVLVFLLIRRSKAPSNKDVESPKDQGVPAALSAEFYPRELAARLFGSEDWEFVVEQGSDQLKRLFLHQRTTLALSWLSSVRANATKLIRVHGAMARTNSRLEPLVEVRVIVDYLFVQILCWILALAIWLRGPVNLSHFIRYANDLSKQLYEVTMQTQSRLAQ